MFHSVHTIFFCCSNLFTRPERLSTHVRVYTLRVYHRRERERAREGEKKKERRKEDEEKKIIGCHYSWEEFHVLYLATLIKLYYNIERAHVLSSSQ